MSQKRFYVIFVIGMRRCALGNLIFIWLYLNLIDIKDQILKPSYRIELYRNSRPKYPTKWQRINLTLWATRFCSSQLHLLLNFSHIIHVLLLLISIGLKMTWPYCSFFKKLSFIEGLFLHSGIFLLISLLCSPFFIFFRKNILVKVCLEIKLIKRNNINLEE